jgi:hypothetical protein
VDQCGGLQGVHRQAPALARGDGAQSGVGGGQQSDLMIGFGMRHVGICSADLPEGRSSAGRGKAFEMEIVL